MSIAAARVLHREADRDRRVVQNAWPARRRATVVVHRRDIDLSVGKVGVRQSEAEFVARGDVLRVEPPVVDEEFLGTISTRASRRGDEPPSR